MMAMSIAQMPIYVARALIRGYQFVLSPILPMSCRFHPTCSDYARDALAGHGFVRGTVFALWRVMRCNPWNRGGFDPVPDTDEALACPDCGHSNEPNH